MVTNRGCTFHNAHQWPNEMINVVGSCQTCNCLFGFGLNYVIYQFLPRKFGLKPPRMLPGGPPPPPFWFLKYGALLRCWPRKFSCCCTNGGGPRGPFIINGSTSAPGPGGPAPKNGRPGPGFELRRDISSRCCCCISCIHCCCWICCSCNKSCWLGLSVNGLLGRLGGSLALPRLLNGLLRGGVSKLLPCDSSHRPSPSTKVGGGVSNCGGGLNGLLWDCPSLFGMPTDESLLIDLSAYGV